MPERGSTESCGRQARRQDEQTGVPFGRRDAGGRGGDQAVIKDRINFTFFGGRYFSFTATGKVTLKSIAFLPVMSIAPEDETGTIAFDAPR